MTKLFMKAALLSAALLLGTAGVSTYAAGVTIGGGNGNVANAQGGANGSDANLNIDSSNGPLATVDNNGNPVDGSGSQTNGDVNLGSLLAGIDLGGIDVGGGGGTGDVGGGAGGGGQAILASLSTGNRQLLKTRCRDVLGDPSVYKDNVVALCRLIGKM